VSLSLRLPSSNSCELSSLGIGDVPPLPQFFLMYLTVDPRLTGLVEGIFFSFFFFLRQQLLGLIGHGLPFFRFFPDSGHSSTPPLAHSPENHYHFSPILDAHPPFFWIWFFFVLSPPSLSSLPALFLPGLVDTEIFLPGAAWLEKPSHTFVFFFPPTSGAASNVYKDGVTCVFS